MYELKDYSQIKIEGLSPELMKNHLTLYEGYVKNTNSLLGQLEETDDEVITGELKRRFGWEWNGMRLHEYFFENIGSGEELSHNALQEKIERNFGSFENWLKDFKRICLMRGIGWAALYYDEQADRLLNVWIDEHNAGHLSGCRLLLVIDLFEHAFIVDNLKRPDYAEIITKAIKWSEVEKRFE